MVSTVWSVSRCRSSTHGSPRAQPFVKVGARAPPCPTESAPLPICTDVPSSETFQGQFLILDCVTTAVEKLHDFKTLCNATDMVA